jgi:tetrahydromethanopterin S-methyltransferase subunit G
VSIHEAPLVFVQKSIFRSFRKNTKRERYIVSPQDFKDWESASQIDPLILRLLQKKYETPAVSQREHPVKRRHLGILYAAFIGVSAMVMVILLGIIRCTDVDIILVNSCQSLLVFCTIGFIAGKIAEMCVDESAKSMLREMLQRTDSLRNTGESDS